MRKARSPQEGFYWREIRSDLGSRRNSENTGQEEDIFHEGETGGKGIARCRERRLASEGEGELLSS